MYFKKKIKKNNLCYLLFVLLLSIFLFSCGKSNSGSKTSAILSSITVTPSNPSITNGTTQQFTATGIYLDKSSKDITTSVTWSSSSTAVATISNDLGSNGLAGSVSIGSTTISAAIGSTSGTTLLTVTKSASTGITVTPSIAAGLSFIIALKSDGTVWGWGDNTSGQLGTGTNDGSYTPVLVSGISNITAISVGFYHTLALKSDGTVWAWGDNTSGELGNGTTTSSNIPVEVMINASMPLSGVIAIAAAYGAPGSETTSGMSLTPTGGFSLALKSDGTIWAWGDNTWGELGNGTTTNSSSPLQVSNITGVKAIAAGVNFALALKSDYTVWAWGNNWSAQLGNGTYTNNYVPGQVSAISSIIAIAAGTHRGLALRSDGTVWAWGGNSWGELGDGTLATRTTPVQVNGLTNVTALSAGGIFSGNYGTQFAFGDFSLALKSDGTVWAWGDNDYGELGNLPAGTGTLFRTPVQIGSLSSITAITTGGNDFAVALKSDGTLWSWGCNTAGELGIGYFSTGANVTPVQVSGILRLN